MGRFIEKKVWGVAAAMLLSVAAPLLRAESNASGFEDLLKSVAQEALKEVTEEKLGDITGKYKGEIEEVKLLERRGNRLVLEVKYGHVKHPDGVVVKAEVLYGGEPMPQFRSSLGQVKGKRGTVRVTISQQKPGTIEGESEEEWGFVTVEEEEGKKEAETLFTDQIRLYMVRENDPKEHRFGTLLFDLPKTWNGTDAPDVEEAQREEAKKEESVTLEEESKPTPEQTPVFVPAGSILKPLPPVKAVPPIKPETTSKTKSSIKPIPVQGLPTPHVFRLEKGTYSLYKEAHKARWVDSDSHRVTYAKQAGRGAAFVTKATRALLKPGNRKVAHVIVTMPPLKRGARIIGDFPPVKLLGDAKFKAVVGFDSRSKAKKANVTVYLKTKKNGKDIIYWILKTPLDDRRYRPIMADLKRWKGKRVQIGFMVQSLSDTKSTRIIWVNPRIEAR